MRNLVVVALLITAGSGPFAQDEDPWIWRCPENDAVNSLYLFLRVQGYEQNYDRFLVESRTLQRDSSMVAIQEVAERLGGPTAIRKMSIEQLGRSDFPKPAIVFFEQPGLTTGKWNVLVYCSTDHAAIVVGSTMVIKFISLDEFRREWSGYALVNSLAESPTTTYVRWISIGMLIAAIVMLVRQKRAASPESKE